MSWWLLSEKMGTRRDVVFAHKFTGTLWAHPVFCRLLTISSMETESHFDVVIRIAKHVDIHPDT